VRRRNNDAVSSLFFSGIKGFVGFFQQSFAIVGMGRETGDATADGYLNNLIIGFQSQTFDLFANALGYYFSAGGLGMGQNYDQFFAAKACRHIYANPYVLYEDC